MEMGWSAGAIEKRVRLSGCIDCTPGSTALAIA